MALITLTGSEEKEEAADDHCEEALACTPEETPKMYMPVGTHKETCTAGTINDTHERPSVIDFQNIQRSIRKVQEIAQEWIGAYESGFKPSATNSTVTRSNGASSKVTALLLGDKCHVKQFLSVVRMVQYQAYLLTPSWMRIMVWPARNRKRNEECDQDELLDGFDVLGFAEFEDCGYFGQDLRDDRILVGGMEGLALLTEDGEAREENDRVVAEGMECFELLIGEE
ncbi:hypothetical protein H2198_003596 [Neophaeococcomyces mojaviensis]|uniref:Uncharacterized protein n=1 Tax=Neophaeococcomyces mojaviensis TaxID=3383035 RepID=A0ACC3AAV1_9EURO|nr:hypothetical protein H2198_003596 [Knufia sp. JES_112]